MSRTPDREVAARLWAHDEDGTYKPPRQFPQATREIATHRKRARHFGAAWAGVMRRYFGSDNVAFTMTIDAPSPVKSRFLIRFSQAAREAGCVPDPLLATGTSATPVGPRVTSRASRSDRRGRTLEGRKPIVTILTGRGLYWFPQWRRGAVWGNPLPGTPHRHGGRRDMGDDSSRIPGME